MPAITPKQAEQSQSSSIPMQSKVPTGNHRQAVHQLATNAGLRVDATASKQGTESVPPEAAAPPHSAPATGPRSEGRHGWITPSRLNAIIRRKSAASAPKHSKHDALRHAVANKTTVTSAPVPMSTFIPLTEDVSRNSGKHEVKK